MIYKYRLVINEIYFNLICIEEIISDVIEEIKEGLNIKKIYCKNIKEFEDIYNLKKCDECYKFKKLCGICCNTKIKQNFKIF